MNRLLRPAFVVTGYAVAVSGCGESSGIPRDGRTHNPPMPTQTALATGSPTGQATTLPTATTGVKAKGVVHPVDIEQRPIMRNRDGTCYVQVPKAGKPPENMMSGERWLENKAVPCPKEYDEPEFAAIPPGAIWIQDERTGECSQRQLYGNPPPPDTKAKCPPSLKKK